MRVIAGTARGIPLKAVPGVQTRPTADKVKESIFNIIGPFFEGGTAIDLFAGSGGLAIEALSRGFDRAIFTDKNQKAVEVIQFNLAKSRFSEQAEVYRADAGQAIRAMAKKGIIADLLFLDPPYKKSGAYRLMETAAAAGILADGATVVCEHDSGSGLAAETEHFSRYRLAEYGGTAVSFYRLRQRGEE